MHDKKKYRFIRLLLIFIIFNMIISLMAYILDWVNDTFFHFDWSNWQIVEWWFVISIIITIFGIFFYLTPMLDEWLYYKLELKIKNISDKLKQEEEKNEGEIRTIPEWSEDSGNL